MQRKEKTRSTTQRTARLKASTEDILGKGSKKRSVASKWARHHNDLVQLREQILAKKGALTGDANAHRENPLFGEHMADAATDSYDRDWALSMLSSSQNAFYEIEQALERIRHGTYGICEFTGKTIEADRLQAVPWTRFCAAAQREFETKGLMERTHLGQLGGFASANDELSPAEEEEIAAAAEEKAPAS